MCYYDCHLLLNGVSCLRKKGVSIEGRFLGTPKLPWQVGLGEGHMRQFSTDKGLDWMGIRVCSRSNRPSKQNFLSTFYFSFL